STGKARAGKTTWTESRGCTRGLLALAGVDRRAVREREPQLLDRRAGVANRVALVTTEVVRGRLEVGDRVFHLVDRAGEPRVLGGLLAGALGAGDRGGEHAPDEG